MAPNKATVRYDSLVAVLTVAFGRAVRFARMRRGWDQSELATQAGLNRGYLGKIEGGRGNPTLDVIAKLAAAMGTTASGLIREAEDEESRRDAGATASSTDSR